MASSENRGGAVKGGSRRGAVALVVVLVALAFVGGFAALVVADLRQRSEQRAAEEPVEGVEVFDGGAPNRHTRDLVDYEQDPPVGGEHHPVWQNARFYDRPIHAENAVHTMEHGAVWISYSPDLPFEQKKEIKDLVEDQTCLLASPHEGLPEETPIVASAWGYQLKIASVDDVDLQRFITAYRQGPQTPEPGAACTNGTSETRSP